MNLHVVSAPDLGTPDHLLHCIDHHDDVLTYLCERIRALEAQVKLLQQFPTKPKD